ncbi:MAG: prepilin-type N-terminal cleavage/methylation domain-containing protein [Vulcanimicrobiota bacterium]
MLSTKYKHGGFSLAEVMIAILVIVIGLAGVTAALVYGIRNSTRGKYISESTQLARTYLEYTQNTGLLDSSSPGEPWPTSESGINDAPQDRSLLNAPPFGGLSFIPDRVEKYRRNIRVERLADDPDNHRYNLARVTVNIYWNDTQGEHRSELTGVVRHVRN